MARGSPACADPAFAARALELRRGCRRRSPVMPGGLGCERAPRPGMAGVTDMWLPVDVKNRLESGFLNVSAVRRHAGLAVS
jgi:hypothetical protein